MSPKWTEQEIRRLIFLKRCRQDDTRCWSDIAKQMNRRAAQQCKSYYNCNIKKYKFKRNQNNEICVNTEFCRDCFQYVIQPKEDLDISSQQYIKNIFIGICWEDIFSYLPLIQALPDDKSQCFCHRIQGLKINTQLLAGWRMVLQIYLDNRQAINDAVQKNPQAESLRVNNFTVSPEEWRQFDAEWQRIDPTHCINQIDIVLKSLGETFVVVNGSEKQQHDKQGTT